HRLAQPHEAVLRLDLDEQVRDPATAPVRPDLVRRERDRDGRGANGGDPRHVTSRAEMKRPASIVTPIVVARITLAIAFTDGSTPRRSLPQIRIGSVSFGPIVKNVMMNSSNDHAIAIRIEPISAGRTSGNVILRNDCHGFAPRSRDASAIDGSSLARRAFTISTTNGSVTSACPTITVFSEGRTPIWLKNESSETARKRPGTISGAVTNEEKTFSRREGRRESA